jgi:hypothetical protein
MGGLNARLFPAPLALFHPLQGLAAGARTEALQRASPLLGEALVAARPVAATAEKILP